MKLYNFMRLIEKYSVTFCLKKNSGKYVAGKWVKDNDALVQMNGAIVPISDHKIYSSGGTLTAKDRELYLTKPLEGSLSELKVIYKGDVYSVEASRNFEDYADAVIYTLKWVSNHD